MADALGSVSGLASGIQWRDLIDQVMKLESSRQLDPITKRQSADTTAVAAWKSYQSLVTTLRDASTRIARQSALSASTATAATSPSGRSLLTATASAGATPASFSVQVDSLAAAEKLQSKVVASSTTALQLTGAFSVNGATITVTTDDTLATIRDRINATNTGATPSRVSASIVTGSDGSARMILSADATGADGIRLIDGTSETAGVLASLGLSDGSTQLQTASNGSIRSFGFSSKTAVIAAMIGVTPPPAGVLQVDGHAVAVDLSADSLSAIVTRINTAGGHASLSGTGATQHIEITGSLAGSDARTLEVLGLSRAGRGSVNQSAVTGTVLTMDDASPVGVGSLLMSLGNGVGSATVASGETISIRGTRPDGSWVDTAFTIDGTSTLGDLLGTIQTALGTPARPVTATLDGGRIRVTDSIGGDSELAFSLVANNEVSGTLSFGATTTSDVGRLRKIIAGADAQIRIDGTLVRRSTNTISDAISGVTLSLQAAEAAAPISVVVGRDVEAAVTSMKAFATAYNAAMAFVAQQKATGGPLANAASLRATTSNLRHALLDDVAGLSTNGGLTRASQAGVAIDKLGLLQVDATKLRATLATDASALTRLFAASATTTGTGVEAPFWSDATVPGTYTMHVTAPATAAVSTSAAFATYAASDGISDTLAIRDSTTGKTVNVDIANGMAIDDVVTALNGAFVNDQLQLVASKNGSGQVVLTTTAFGAAATFTVTGATGGSLAALDTVQAGTDITGWFRSGATTYAAVGSGQQLTGAAGTPAAGLSARYTGTTPAIDVGTVTVILGVAGAMERAGNLIVRPNDGTIATRTTTLLEHAESLNARVDTVQERLDRYRTALIRQYTAMETALSRIQSQQNWLTSQVNSMNGNR